MMREARLLGRPLSSRENEHAVLDESEDGGGPSKRVRALWPHGEATRTLLLNVTLVATPHGPWGGVTRPASRLPRPSPGRPCRRKNFRERYDRAGLPRIRRTLHRSGDFACLRGTPGVGRDGRQALLVSFLQSNAILTRCGRLSAFIFSITLARRASIAFVLSPS